jgi:hypothetical protein
MGFRALTNIEKTDTATGAHAYLPKNPLVPCAARLPQPKKRNESDASSNIDGSLFIWRLLCCLLLFCLTFAISPHRKMKVVFLQANSG